MKVRLINKTTGIPGTEYENKTIDEIIVGIARLSSSRELNNLFTEPDKLIRHCLLHSHWSIFEMANLTFEVVTSRAMGREILRHSLHKQEFSARYAPVLNLEPVELRKPAKSNRQSSSVVINPYIESQESFADELVNKSLTLSQQTYNNLLEEGVAKECARMILPETAETTLILNGEIRLWISFLNQRLHKTAQKEIREVANEIKTIFMKECPVISKALLDFKDAEELPILDQLIIQKYAISN